MSTKSETSHLQTAGEHLGLARDHVTVGVADAVNAGNEGKLVHVVGKAEAAEPEDAEGLPAVRSRPPGDGGSFCGSRSPGPRAHSSCISG